MINAFNVRVYALCINQKKELLTLHEEYVGEYLTKLPGGGLEYGEGTIECLRRELAEELNLNIKSATHFYTQEDFVESKFRENEQLITIYYKVEMENEADLVALDPCIERVEWYPIGGKNPFNLPVDRLVYEKLLIDK